MARRFYTGSPWPAAIPIPGSRALLEDEVPRPVRVEEVEGPLLPVVGDLVVGADDATRPQRLFHAALEATRHGFVGEGGVVIDHVEVAVAVVREEVDLHDRHVEEAARAFDVARLDLDAGHREVEL